MKPVTVSAEVPNEREEVYAFLDVLANHEPFTDHMMVDWELSGPRAGVGATATAKVRTPGSNEIIEIKVTEADPPRRIVEESVSGGGKRRTRGTYTLEELAEGGTRISFELAWLDAPRNERMAAPLMRAFMRRANRRAMRRLAKILRGR
jgi:Polyketide cyclase / dehydrase and lipid transport